MKHTFTKLAAFGLMLTLLGSLAACGVAAPPTAGPAAPAADAASAGAKPGKTIKVGFTAINLADAVIAKMTSDMKAAAQKNNIDLTISDSGGDPNKQVSAVDNFIAAGDDVIIIQALNPQAMEPGVKAAMAKGIKIVAFGIGLKDYDVWYKNDNYLVGQTIGKMAGDWINEKAGGNAKVALIEFPVVPVLIDRVKGIEDALKKTAPKAEIVARGSAIEGQSGLKLGETFLQKDPDIKVIVSISDGPGMGAFEAIKTAGRNTDDFAIFGSDVAPDAVTQIAKGSAYRGTVDTDSKISGAKSMQIASDLVNGKPVEKIIVMGAIPVTSKNIADYK